MLYILGRVNFRQHRGDPPLPRACVSARAGQVRDDAGGRGPLLRDVGARVRHVRLILPQQT